MRAAAADERHYGQGDHGSRPRHPCTDATVTALARPRILDHARVERLDIRRFNNDAHRLRDPLCCGYLASFRASMASSMFDVKIDRDDEALLHQQVAAQIRKAIVDGEAKPGDRLPPARHLAAVMQVNTNTVLRAVRMLRDEGLLELRQGHSIGVTGTPERSALLDRVAELVQLGRQSGITRAQLARMVENVP
jgi:GntR family transcriptional regulator